MRIGALTIVLWVSGAVAQSSSANTVAVPDPASLGSVMGHVTLPESNLPARFASVMLQPADMKPYVPKGGSDDEKMQVKVVQTGLDGGYRLDGVMPGTYYVVATLPGYLSPIAQYTMEQLTHPTPDVQQKITATVPLVDVRPNAIANTDVRLTRGASISGVVRFDDGSPNPAAKLALLKRNEKGQFEGVQWPKELTVQNDGSFRVDGLTAGEYTLRLSLEVQQKKQSGVLGWVGMSSSNTTYSLDFYSGETTIFPKAKALKLLDGESLTGQDFTIPVAKLHAVSGSVLDVRTGQALNSGSVTLVDSDGNGVCSTHIDAETRTFNFGFAPEGEYTARISDARETVPGAATSGSRAAPKPKTLRSYDLGEIPLIVHGDITGVTIQVKEKSDAAKVVTGSQ